MKALCWNNSGNLVIEDYSGKTWNPDDALVNIIMSTKQNGVPWWFRASSVMHAGCFNGDTILRDEIQRSAIHYVAQQNCVKVGSIGCGVCSYSRAGQRSHHERSEAMFPESAQGLIASGIFG